MLFRSFTRKVFQKNKLVHNPNASNSEDNIHTMLSSQKPKTNGPQFQDELIKAQISIRNAQRKKAKEFSEEGKAPTPEKIQQKIKRTNDLEQLCRLYDAYKFYCDSECLYSFYMAIAKKMPEYAKSRKVLMKADSKNLMPKYSMKDPRIHSLVFQMKDNIASFSGEQVVLVAWATARMVYLFDKKLITNAVEQRFKYPRMTELKTQDLSRLLWTYARAQIESPDFVAFLTLEIQMRLSSFLAAKPEIKLQYNRVSSNGKLNGEEEASRAEKKEQAPHLDEEKEQMEDADTDEDDWGESSEIKKESETPQGDFSFSTFTIYMVIWSMSKMNARDPTMYKMLSEAVERNLDRFTLRELTIILGSIAPFKFEFHKVNSFLSFRNICFPFSK